MKISKPKIINPFAAECLKALQDSGLGKFIALGSAYHLLRAMHGLPQLPYIGQGFPEILNDPYLLQV